MREAEAAISLSGRLSQGSPLPGNPAVLFFPDWRVCGHRFAHETRRPSVPKTVISRPISAMTTKAGDFPARKPGEPTVTNVTRYIQFRLLEPWMIT